MSIQLVHCSDIHLDRNFNFGNPSKSFQRRIDVETNFEKTVDFTISEKSDLFLISGDVFDKVNPSNSARAFFTFQMKKLNEKNIPVIMIGGNHDEPKFGPQAMAIDSLQSAGLATVFSNYNYFEKKTLTINGEQIQVVGKSYNSKDQNQNPFTNYNIKKNSKYLICLVHGSLISANIAPTNPHVTLYHPFVLNDVDSSIDYLGLGHFHNFFQQKGKPTICNPGSLEKLNWSEANDDKGFAFVELNNESVNVQFMPLESRRHKNIEINLDRSIKNINEYILNRIEKIKNHNEILRVKISGLITREQQKTFARSKLASKSDEFFFYCDFVSDLEIEGVGKVFLGKVESPTQAFEKHFNDLLEKTSDKSQRDFILKAKQRGLEYLGEGIVN